MEKEEIIKILELLILYINNKDNPRQPGLCFYLKKLYLEKNITYREHLLLRDYIYMHRPKVFEKFYNYKQVFSSSFLFFWKPGNDKIRVKWLNYQINKLNKLNK